ncbi:MAG: DUF433 domain-containing protein [Richelia sp. RM2_1_2]|nr:DUF433 domain-containing protein [Rivularia sp. T60_A2020_040]NJL80378.1 DUF433 domain-containing protein [Richelia sp. SM2_1_7]NJM17599.1 DUF433 domain-containing protein [Richelia sp. SM1_7_0]NJN07746.1 DUF433 domain-containing protein [Richelia sp. RM1_1_1]NJO26563.1 DUF433 domain-containing protein [Richelia sp. SL_2_1]NJO57778.1 DUF433 domain-containing protein [Richelia sp. RM2_1_2]
MNKRTQLLEAIVALPEELVDQALIYVQMLQNPIQITPGVCGGQARIRNTRIPVWTLVAYRKLGAPDEELLANYPGLTEADLSAAWDYYEQNREQVDRAIVQDESI